MPSPSSHKSNPSLQKKSAARMAAIQCLYRRAMTKECISPAAETAQLKTQLSGNRDEQKLLVGAPIEPDYAMMERLLAGVEKEERDIHSEIDAALSGGWTRARMSALLVSLLECAVCEMFYDKDLSPKIVIDEYTRLARRFFSDDEVGFVHGVLHKLSGRRHG